MHQPSLFPDPRETAPDQEVIEVLRDAICSGQGLTRMADLTLNAVCAEHLVDRLHLAGLEVVRRPTVRFHD